MSKDNSSYEPLTEQEMEWIESQTEEPDDWQERAAALDELRMGEHSDKALSIRDILALPEGDPTCFGQYIAGGCEAWCGADMLDQIEQEYVPFGELPVNIMIEVYSLGYKKLGVYYGTTSERLEGWIDREVLSRISRFRSMLWPERWEKEGNGWLWYNLCDGAWFERFWGPWHQLSNFARHVRHRWRKLIGIV